MLRFLRCNHLRFCLMRRALDSDMAAITAAPLAGWKTTLRANFRTAANLQQDANLRNALPKENKEPVQFSGSEADRDAYETFRTGPEAPSYERGIVKLTTLAFLVYFLALREENDIDDYISAHVYNAMDPYAEIKRLEQRLADEERQGLDTTKTQTRIVELTSLMQENKESGTLEATLKRIELAKLAKDAATNK